MHRSYEVRLSLINLISQMLLFFLDFDLFQIDIVQYVWAMNKIGDRCIWYKTSSREYVVRVCRRSSPTRSCRIRVACTHCLSRKPIERLWRENCELKDLNEWNVCLLVKLLRVSPFTMLVHLLEYHFWIRLVMDLSDMHDVISANESELFSIVSIINKLLSRVICFAFN